MNTSKAEKWKKAAILGSLWASIEILLGSFLHNIKFPLAGTLLSVSSVLLMASFLQVWKEKGIIWRASLITALMKSISPSAIILGPMTGIFAEGLLMELGVSFIGQNTVGILLGGALAVFSTILHKLITLLILYGWDLVRIAEKLYFFAVKQIGFEKLSLWLLLSILSAFYIISGFVAAGLGIYSGKQFLLQENEPDRISVKQEFKKSLFQPSENQHFSSALLLLHLVAISLSIYLLNTQKLFVSFLFIVFYTFIVILRYKSSIRHLKKVSFWIQALLLTFLAAIFWNEYKNGAWFHPSGIIAGVKLNLRAIALLIGFSAISVELRNPFIKSILFRKGFRFVYESVNLSFSVLPYVFENTPRIRESFKQPTKFIQNMLLISINLYDYFQKHRAKIFIVTGEIQEGKTSYVSKLANLLINKGIKPGGFLALGVHNKDGERVGFELSFLPEGKRFLMCTTTENENWHKTGKYYFNPATISYGSKKLVESEADLYFIDEIGQLELEYKGWFDALYGLNTQKQPIQIWVVRKHLVSKVQALFPFADYEVWDISEIRLEKALTKIEESVGVHFQKM